MNEKFFDLKKEKQNRMINAGLKIFALHGYRHASTDDIVAEARISKGLIFHYFSSKIGLYRFLFDYSVRFMSLNLSACVTGSSMDYFELILRMENSRCRVLKNHPYMQLFIDGACYETDPEIVAVIEEKKSILKEMREDLLKKADFSALSPGTDVERLTCMAEYTMQGMMREQILTGSFDPEVFLEEVKGYLALLRQL